MADLGEVKMYNSVTCIADNKRDSLEQDLAERLTRETSKDAMDGKKVVASCQYTNYRFFDYVKALGNDS